MLYKQQKTPHVQASQPDSWIHAKRIKCWSLSESESRNKQLVWLRCVSLPECVFTVCFVTTTWLRMHGWSKQPTSAISAAHFCTFRLNMYPCEHKWVVNKCIYVCVYIYIYIFYEIQDVVTSCFKFSWTCIIWMNCCCWQMCSNAAAFTVCVGSHLHLALCHGWTFPCSYLLQRIFDLQNEACSLFAWQV